MTTDFLNFKGGFKSLGLLIGVFILLIIGGSIWGVKRTIKKRVAQAEQRIKEQVKAETGETLGKLANHVKELANVTLSQKKTIESMKSDLKAFDEETKLLNQSIRQMKALRQQERKQFDKTIQGLNVKYQQLEAANQKKTNELLNEINAVDSLNSQ